MMTGAANMAVRSASPAAAGKLSAFERVAAPRRLTHGLIARITADITSGRLKPGARLPSRN
jgi:DNA-binding GntR family transcriptional regulator